MPGSTYNDFISQQRQRLNPTPGPAPGLTGETAASNVSASPDLTSLTNLVNSLNQNAQTSANADRVPGSAGIESTLSGNTAQLAQGQLPTDVTNQIAQAAAERGVTTGNNNMLQQLGLNSLQAQQTAEQNITSADARNPVAPIFDPTTQLITPYQQGSLTNQANMTTLDWLNSLFGGERTGTTPSPRSPSAGAAPAATPAPADNTWWNSLFPTTATGTSPTTPNLYTPQSTSLAPNDPGLPDLGSPNYLDTLPNPAGTSDPNNPDPFAIYG